METTKEKILRLRDEGKTYNQIMEEVGCSKGTISYHCGNGQKEKSAKRRKKRRENLLIRKLDSYKYRTISNTETKDKPTKTRKDVVESIRKFQKSDITSFGRVNADLETTFTWEDLLELYGEDTFCYLSGEPINLMVNNYQLDHKVPVCRDGDNTLSNLGITHEVVNRMKGDLTPEELIDWCVKILKFNGYNVSK